MAIEERFDLGERIGGGAVADVHRAFDHELDRDVVVRLLRADAAGDEAYVERFEREAEAATGIRHRNVVEVLDHGVIDGRPFVVRELVEGSTLHDLLERHGPLPEEVARALAEQIARGIAAAHARGVLHRDLNAGNVFVTPEGTAKVSDFGMPTVPRHPAPEQVSREQIDERTDVYGIGAVLYQMLTGHAPRGRLVPPRQLARRVSERIEAIALRALEADPARRYATAAAMADALAPAPVVIPIATPRRVPAPTERLTRPTSTVSSRRRTSVPPFILVVIPMLLALLVAAFTLPRSAPTNTAVLSATTTPQPTTAPTAFPATTLVPPVETTPEPTTPPTPEPTVAPPSPTPAPTLAPAPPPAAAPPPQAPAAPAPTSATPAASVVRSFYELINQKRFDEAAGLWSSRMRANYPPSTNIYGRFDRTREIVIREIAPVPQNTGGATVAIDILEVLDSGVTRRWVGQWYLVWDGSRWLMDAPNLRAG